MTAPKSTKQTTPATYTSQLGNDFKESNLRMTMRLCIGQKDLKFFQQVEPEQTALRSRYRHKFYINSSLYTRLDVAVLRGQIDAHVARQLFSELWFRDLHLQLYESGGTDGMCPKIWMTLETYLAPSCRRGCWFVRTRRNLFHEDRALEILYESGSWIRLGRSVRID